MSPLQLHSKIFLQIRLDMKVSELAEITLLAALTHWTTTTSSLMHVVTVSCEPADEHCLTTASRKCRITILVSRKCD